MVEIVVNTTTSGTALSAITAGAGAGMIAAAVSQVSSVTNSVKGIASSAISICNQLVDILTLFNNGINLAILDTAISAVNVVIEALQVFAAGFLKFHLRQRVPHVQYGVPAIHAVSQLRILGY